MWIYTNELYMLATYAADVVIIIEAHNPEMISATGYPVESHVVRTEDGYILTMHRIPHGKVPDSTKRPVVFLFHGLMCSSADFVVIGPERALAYQLVDRGYDVWMGNARGNTYSRNHETLDPDSAEFWDFSWHEIGIYDLKAMLDYVLSNTGSEKLHYIGHSQGSTTIFVMLSILTDYNNYFYSVSALSPLAYMYHSKSPVMRAIALSELPVEVMSSILGYNEFLPSDEFTQTTAAILCMNDQPLQEVCANILFLLAGYDSEQLNRTELPAILANTPAGASTKQILHYSQSVYSNNFRQYDYGPVTNLIEYGTLTPPDYALDQITAPVGLFYSQNDWVADVKDVEQLHSRLPNVVKYYNVPFPKFNHLDFTYAIDVIPLLYDELINFLDSRTN
ncbi:lipase 3-like [Phlebotomus papatasi]|uniref:lipase 3-like n=1 Tax=Phlebotomus papatasi TaxID=29031 RepID=UPI00248451D8|nr:lipase 3-like [Phlebotomus papatasi]